MADKPCNGLRPCCRGSKDRRAGCCFHRQVRPASGCSRGRAGMACRYRVPLVTGQKYTIGQRACLSQVTNGPWTIRPGCHRNDSPRCPSTWPTASSCARLSTAAGEPPPDQRFSLRGGHRLGSQQRAPYPRHAGSRLMGKAAPRSLRQPVSSRPSSSPGHGHRSACRRLGHRPASTDGKRSAKAWRARGGSAPPAGGCTP